MSTNEVSCDSQTANGGYDFSSRAPDAVSTSLFFNAPDAREQSSLLDGFRCFIEFILDAEADFLCGVLMPLHSWQRPNCRMGYYHRNITTMVGKCAICVPYLRCIHPRPSIVKRAKRLSPIILESLARIRVGGVTPAEVSLLVNLIWTMSMPAGLLEILIRGLTPVLNNWRNGIPVEKPRKLRKPSKPRKRKDSINAPAQNSASAGDALTYAVY